MDGLLDDLPQATTFEDVSQVLLSSALSLVGEVVFGESTLNLSSERAPYFLPYIFLRRLYCSSNI